MYIGFEAVFDIQEASVAQKYTIIWIRPTTSKPVAESYIRQVLDWDFAVVSYKDNLFFMTMMQIFQLDYKAIIIKK